MYTPRAIFCRLFLQICPFVLSLYALGRLVTLSCEISDQSPITCVNSHYRVQHCPRAKYGLCTYITWIRKCGWKIWPCEFTKWRPNTTVRSAVPENPIIEPNMKGLDWRVAELWPFEISQYVWIGPEVGRWSVVGRQYSYFLHWSHILLSRYVRNVAHEE